jgi:hypothetical protein
MRCVPFRPSSPRGLPALTKRLPVEEVDLDPEHDRLAAADGGETRSLDDATGAGAVPVARGCVMAAGDVPGVVDDLEALEELVPPGQVHPEAAEAAEARVVDRPVRVGRVVHDDRAVGQHELRDVPGARSCRVRPGGVLLQHGPGAVPVRDLDRVLVLDE